MRWKGGLVGCGFFGSMQHEAWMRMPDVEIAAACDLDRERGARMAPHAYTSAEEMLDREQLDFVDIATRPESHLPLVRLAVRQKLPVICQKPLAPNWEDAAAIVETAESAGIRFMVHENWRWQPWYREVKKMIERGDIGTPLSYWFRHRKGDGLGSGAYPDQPYFRRMPRLLVYETLVHYIDTARVLFGEIASVYAQARTVNPEIAGEDQALLMLAHQSGLPGVIDGHRFLEPEPPGPAMGDAGVEGEAGRLRVLATGDVLLGARTVWTNEVRSGYKGDSVLATQRHFIDCLETGQEFETGGREYLGTFGAVEAAYRSIRECRRIDLSTPRR